MKPVDDIGRQPGRLAGRRILVTGAASGIGRATALLFQAQGARVAWIDRDARVKAEAEGAAFAATADVSSEQQVAGAVTAASQALGGLDGIVNSAGVSKRASFGETTLADWHAILAVNLTGPFLVCRAAWPYLRAAGAGAIVNIASGVALRPIPGCTAYAASKNGLIGFSKALAVDLAPSGVRVNTICPGPVDTPMIRRSTDDSADPRAALAMVLERRLLKRFGRPEEIAHAALFLMADDCTFATGSVFAIDGGGTMH